MALLERPRYADVTRLLRLYRMPGIVGRYRLDDMHSPQDRHPVLPGLATESLAPAAARDLPRGVRLRRALEELGPVFIKFGQMLSTRRDLLPTDIADELAKLQDEVPPFPQEQSVAIIEEAGLGSALSSELFADFDRSPMASASVAQVHAARLPRGPGRGREGDAARISSP
jgi:ubiquinone biosynthesis protein